MKKHILLVALTCITFSFGVVSKVVLADSHEHKHPRHKMDTHKIEEMAQKCEAHLGKVKDQGGSLPADLKAEFDYFLKIVNIELEAIKDPNLKDPRKHARSCHRRLKKAERVLKKQERQMEREKKKEERKAKKKAAHQEHEKLDHEKLDHGKVEGETSR